MSGDGWKVQVIGRSAQAGIFVTKEEAVRRTDVVARKENGEVSYIKKMA